MSRGDIAKENFFKGFNCSQAVALSFSDLLDVDADSLSKMCIGFGGGLARQRLTCGAVSGMTFVLGALLSDGMDKGYIYSIVQSACADFKNEVGSLVCGDLLEGKIKFDGSPSPDERTTEYYKKRPCPDLCKLAGDITEKYLKEYGIIK